MAREITVGAGTGLMAMVRRPVLCLMRRPTLRRPRWLLPMLVFWLAFAGCGGVAEASPPGGELPFGGQLLKGWRVRERAPNRPSEGSARELVIVATSDLHGWITRDTLFPGSRPGGLAHLAPILADLRRESPGLILVDGGDTMQGAPNLEYLARRDAARPPLVLRLMNRLRYDAMTLGNHDLEQGQRALARWVGQSTFPWLAANMLGPEGRPVLPPYRIIERGDVRVAVLGLITPGTPIWVDGRHVAGLRFTGMRAAVRRWMPVLRERERADVIIGVFHSGLAGWYDRAVAVRHGLPLPNGAGLIADDDLGFDLIVSGHAHRLAPRRMRGADSDYTVPAVLPGARGEGLAVARLRLRGVGGRWEVAGMTRETRRASIAPDAALLADLAPVLRRTRAWLAEPTAVRLTAIPDRNLFHQCSGELSHDAISGLDAALLEPTGLTSEGAARPGMAGHTAAGRGSPSAENARAPISLLPLLWRLRSLPLPRSTTQPIPLRRAHIHRWMPYANTLVLARLNPRQMALLLDPFARRRGGLRVRSSAVLHPGGLKARIAPQGTEVLGLALAAGGPELPRHEPRPVWLTNYHWNGGGGLARRALLHPSQLAGRSRATLRGLVFRLLSRPDYELPPACRRFLAKAPSRKKTS